MKYDLLFQIRRYFRSVKGKPVSYGTRGCNAVQPGERGIALAVGTTRQGAGSIKGRSKAGGGYSP
jgi:hypothetical protein